MANAFSFGNSTEEPNQLPYVPFDAFKELKEGTVINGVAISATIFKGQVSLQVEVEKHITSVKLWDVSIDQAKKLIGQDVRVKFTGMREWNGKHYPKLYLAL